MTPAPTFTTRVLPPDEWARLAGTEQLGPVASLLDPETTDVLVVERDGEIVGTWAVLPVWHLEGAWIHPDHRGKGSVARHLWGAMRRMLRQRHIGGVMTTGASDEVRALIAHLQGQPVLGQTYVLSLGDTSCPPHS